MFPIIANAKNSIPIITVNEKEFPAVRAKLPPRAQNWIKANGFNGEAGKFYLVPDENGALAKVVAGIAVKPDMWSIAHLADKLPPGAYHLEGKFAPHLATGLALGWALQCYRFTKYKKSMKEFATLIAPKDCDLPYLESMAEAIFWARDMINTPANDMNPAALAKEAADWAKSAGADVRVLKGEELLKANYPTVYTVGKAASVPPYLVDIRFPRKGAKKVALVGKGVCFDSGGLDIKSTSNMKWMKKDMAGAAAMLALAKVLVETRVKVELRVLLPIVENAVAGNAMRPLDIVKTRSGKTVEIGNTDAEGRLILCDALWEADSEKPDLLIDYATLTGAARVAVGTEISAFFTPDDKLAGTVMKASEHECDPLWRLPLWMPYRYMLDTPNADISNDPDSGYAGAITAALYLQEFVSKTPSWLHIDTMAWNLRDRPGRPKGAEAMAVRTLYALIREKYGR